MIINWTKINKKIFKEPTDEDIKNLKKIFSIPHFRNIINQKNILRGKPLADPFIIAYAMSKNAIVVTEEKYTKNGFKIPNICEYFSIKCINLEKFMEFENFIF